MARPYWEIANERWGAGSEFARRIISGTTTASVADAPTAVPAGQVQFIQGQGDNEQRVTLWLASPVRRTGSGFGGWTVAPVDGSKSVLEFDGPDLERWTVPVLVNGWSDEIDQNETWQKLWAMAGMRGDKPPDVVWVYGNVPPDVQSRQWVIESIAPADPPAGVLHSADNKLWREAATVTIIEPEFPELVADPIKRAQRKSGKAKKQRTVTAKKGDTLLTIAARVYGNPARWRDIAGANPNLPGYGDPEAVKAGETIKLPD